MAEHENSSLTFFYASVFMVSLGLGAYLFLLPIFITRLGGTYFDLGLVGMTRSIAYTLLPIFAGYLADRLGARRLYLFSIGVNGLAAALLTLAQSVPQVLVIQILSGIGFAFLWPTTETLVASSSEDKNRVRAMGRYSVSWALGFLLGPLIGGFISERLGFTSLFLLSSTAIILGVPILLKTRVNGLASNPIVKAGKFWNFGVLKPALPVYAMIIPYGMSFGLIVAILPGYLSNLGVSEADVGVLFSLLGIARIWAFFLAHKITQFEEAVLTGLLTISYSISLLVISLSFSYLHFVVAMVLFGFATGIFFPVTASIAPRLVPRENLGTAMGAYENFFGIGFTIGPILGGTLAAAWSPSSPYLAMAFISIISLPILALWRGR